MPNTISLSAYVKKRNGVALGASGSMRHMLKRSLGAGSFYLFWRYWNPIWGYYLSRYVMKPLIQFLPAWLAVFLTFAVSGAIHDMAVTVVKLEWTFFFTPWFMVMGLLALLTRKGGVSFHPFPWPVRALLNICCILMSLWLILWLTQLFQ
jgi:hypothetical protein